jgi:hypothetical protein
MSDSERDAWLREALRHAPDADAAPPRDLSETILAQARAAARAGSAPARATRRRNRVLALWDWLARPPVAAGFASVMAATLVGMMWWGRPMDETLPPRPEAAAMRTAPSPPADTGASTGSDAQLKRSSAPDQRSGVHDARAPAATMPSVDTIAPQSARGQSEEGATRSDNKVAPVAKAEDFRAPQMQMQAPPANAAATEAKAQQRKLDATTEALAERVPAKPSAFPRSDDERSAAKKKDGDAKDDKALDRAAKEATTDALGMRDTPLAKSLPAPVPAPAPPAGALRSEPPAAFAGQRANEMAQTAPSASADGEAAKRARTAARLQTSPATAAAPTTPAPLAAVAPPPPSRDSASTDLREKQEGALASSRAEQALRGLAPAQREAAAATPLAPLLAAIASDPARWSRSTPAGSVVALEAGWRDWLTQLDAAARDHWQPAGAANERERDGATTLRLVDGGRTAAVVRLDGTTVRIDAIDRGERWQATLPPAAAEQLRAAADRLGR